MKTKDFVQELNGLTTDEMLTKEKELKEQLFNLRFQLATGQLENTASLKQVRKDIARVKTVLRQQELSNK
ncbi:50S ribosomal protein L29 [Paucilactobacillus sp. N302-9]